MESVSHVLDASVEAVVPPPAPSQRACAPRFWTTREEKVLEQRYEKDGAEACLPLLPGRTLSAVYQHAATIGLKGKQFVNGHVNGRFRQRWSSSDHFDALIARTYQGEPKRSMVADLARVLGRPRWWVSKRASQLGLVAPRFKEPPWSQPELEVAIASAHKDPRTIQRMLERHGFKRTATAIVVKLKRQGVSRRDDPDHFSATGLSKLMGIDAKSVMRWIEKGWLKAGRKGTGRTQQQGGDQYWIHRRDLKRFIVENAAVVDLRKVDKFWFIELLGGSA